MKILHIYLAFLFCIFPFILNAQVSDEVSDKMNHALEAQEWDVVEELFQGLISADLNQAEILFWLELPKKHVGCHKMAWILGDYYKEERNYEKAYVFFGELLKLVPEDMDVMTVNAEVSVLRGKETVALGLYEKILEKDAHHIAANIFIGNYYYLHSEKEKQKLDQNYLKIKSPTKMQYAGYRNNLDELYTSGYSKAKKHLKIVDDQFSSIEIRKTLDKIKLIEKEVKK